jgi:hypothetical protein
MITVEAVNAEIDKFISKIRIAESNDTFLVLTPAEAKRLLQAVLPKYDDERKIP